MVTATDRKGPLEIECYCWSWGTATVRYKDLATLPFYPIQSHEENSFKVFIAEDETWYVLSKKKNSLSEIEDLATLPLIKKKKKPPETPASLLWTLGIRRRGPAGAGTRRAGTTTSVVVAVVVVVVVVVVAGWPGRRPARPICCGWLAPGA